MCGLRPKEKSTVECQKCGEEVEELVRVKVGKKTLRVCEQCADVVRESEEIAGEAEGAMKDMMGYKGR
jgi:ribosome-binding protein aMBF1 (putative translation factor)